MVRKHGHLDTEETNEAAWVATWGALTGAARWGIYSAVAGGAAYYFSPVYRGLTFQFKVYLQMSGMTVGSMIEADRRLRLHETMVRQQHRVARDAEVWRRYEEEFEARGVPGIDKGMQNPNEPPQGSPAMDGAGPAGQNSSKHALQDYQMQLMSPEQQNKKRIAQLMARQEQDSANRPNGGPMPGSEAVANQSAKSE